MVGLGQSLGNSFVKFLLFEEKISSLSPSEEDPRFAFSVYSGIYRNEERPGFTPYGTH